MDIGIGVPQDSPAFSGDGTVVALLKALRDMLPPAPPSGPLSGQKTVATAGTSVALGNGAVNGALALKALASNTGLVYVGSDGAGDVHSGNGFELRGGEVIIFDYVDDLGDLFVDSAVNGEGVCWIMLRA